MYYFDATEYPPSASDLMTGAERKEANKLFKKYKNDPTPHANKSVGEKTYALGGMGFMGVAAIWFAADVASGGLVSMLSICAGITMLAVSEYKRQGDRYYHWTNAMGQSVSSTRRIAMTLNRVENRLNKSFNAVSQNKTEQTNLMKEVDFLSRFTILSNDRPYQKLKQPMSIK